MTALIAIRKRIVDSLGEDIWKDAKHRRGVPLQRELPALLKEKQKAKAKNNQIKESKSSAEIAFADWAAPVPVKAD